MGKGGPRCNGDTPVKVHGGRSRFGRLVKAVCGVYLGTFMFIFSGDCSVSYRLYERSKVVPLLRKECKLFFRSFSPIRAGRCAISWSRLLEV